MIYPYRCERCGTNIDRVCSLREYEANPVHLCFQCQEPMKRVLTAPRTLMHTAPFEAFVSPVDGTVITSRTSLREHNKRNNVVQLHEGYDEKAVNNITKQDHRAEQNKGNLKDIKQDIAIAVEKLEQGYKPVVAHEDEIIPT